MYLRFLSKSARAAPSQSKNLAGRSSPKLFQPKVQIEKSAIETNYALKGVFSPIFFRLRSFSNVKLSLQNTTR